MMPYEPFGQWPPEVPPFRRPVPPAEPPLPLPPPGPSPQPALPTREEYETRDRGLADRLLDQRIIMVGGDLDDDLANRTVSRLLVLGTSRAPVELHLTCERSELGAALTLADAVELIRPPVRALVRGVLRGPVVAVLCACEHRAAHHNALFVLSLPETRLPASSAGDVARLSEQLELQEAQLRSRIAGATGHTDEQVAADLSSGRMLSAVAARDYGLLHEVV